MFTLSASGFYDPERSNKVLDVAETALTIPSEGDVLHAYQDPRGIWTIGTVQRPIWQAIR